MQHVKLARDRRKRKSRIKAAIFFVALALIFSGAMLGLKDRAQSDVSVQSELAPQMIDDTQHQSLHPEETDKTTQNTPPGNAPQKDDATSYDDELQAQDDEAEEVKPQFDELDALPQNAQDALSGLLDAADQAYYRSIQLHRCARRHVKRCIRAFRFRRRYSETTYRFLSRTAEFEGRSAILLDFG